MIQHLVRTKPGRHKIGLTVAVESGKETLVGACAPGIATVTDTLSDTSIRIPVGDTFAWVDAADAERVTALIWTAQRKKHLTYAIATIDGRRVKMHQFLLGKEVGLEIDHKDGDGLNNRRDNLRHATHKQNLQSQRLRAGVKTSRFKGVSRKSSVGKWIAQIKVRGSTVQLGEFRTEEEAAIAYDAAALRYFAEFAKTNASMGLFDQPASLRIGGRYEAGRAL